MRWHEAKKKFVKKAVERQKLVSSLTAANQSFFSTPF